MNIFHMKLGFGNSNKWFHFRSDLDPGPDPGLAKDCALCCSFCQTAKCFIDRNWYFQRKLFPFC